MPAAAPSTNFARCPACKGFGRRAQVGAGAVICGRCDGDGLILRTRRVRGNYVTAGGEYQLVRLTGDAWDVLDAAGTRTSGSFYLTLWAARFHVKRLLLDGVDETPYIIVNDDDGA